MQEVRAGASERVGVTGQQLVVELAHRHREIVRGLGNETFGVDELERVGPGLERVQLWASACTKTAVAGSNAAARAAANASAVSIVRSAQGLSSSCHAVATISASHAAFSAPVGKAVGSGTGTHTSRNVVQMISS